MRKIHLHLISLLYIISIEVACLSILLILTGVFAGDTTRTILYTTMLAASLYASKLLVNIGWKTNAKAFDDIIMSYMGCMVYISIAITVFAIITDGIFHLYPPSLEDILRPIASTILPASLTSIIWYTTLTRIP